MTTKTVKYISPSLFIGSSDKIRSTLGTGFGTNEDGNTEFKSPEMVELNNQSGENVEEYADPTIPFGKIYVKEAEFQQPVSEDLIYPSTKTSVLMVGNSEVIETDFQWKSLIGGGPYGEETYEGIETSAVYDGHYCIQDYPIGKMLAKELDGENYADTNYLTVENVYQGYIPKFEEEAQSIYSLPSYTFMQMVINNLSDYETFREEIRQYVSLNGEYSDDASAALSLSDIFATKQFAWLAPDESVLDLNNTTGEPYGDRKYYINDYYNAWTNTEYSQTVQSFLSQRMKNVFIDTEVMNNTPSPGGNTTDLARLPYYVNVQIPSDVFTHHIDINAGANFDYPNFASYLQEYGWDVILLEQIKKKFVDTQPWPQQLVKITEIGNAQTKTTTTIRSADFNQMLIDEMNAPIKSAEELDFLFVSTNSVEREMLEDIDGSYRYVRSSRASDALEKLVKLFGSEGNLMLTNLPFPYRGDDSWSIGDFLSIPDLRTPMSEIVAFRVEKIGAEQSLGGPAEKKALQNFFFFNDPTVSASGSPFNLIDTQVKYGANYNYNIYAYEAVISYRYVYKGFKISRQTGTSDQSGTEKSCLQFYDTSYSQKQPLLWWEEGNTNLAEEPIEFIDSAYATFSEALSTNNFVAEMVLEIEPYVKISEIPLYSKDIKITDNPPRQVDVTPFQRRDNSQVIGFYLRKEAFIKETYPTTLNAAEDLDKEKYLNSLNLLDDDLLENSSVSALRYVEVYRTNTRPTSFADFDGELITEIDLKLTERIYPSAEEDDFRPTTQTSTVCFYEEAVQTNREYYYTFRFLNEHRMGGKFSPIQIIKLVDDGGYKYLDAGVIIESELNTATNFESVSTSFQKIFELIPNLRQIEFDNSDVDFTQDAYSQIDAVKVGTVEEESSLWGKTFKIRVTSKKTGKKIDLNITYKTQESV